MSTVNSLGITYETHPKFNKLEGLEGKKVKITQMYQCGKEIEEYIFIGFQGRGLNLGDTEFKNAGAYMPFMGNESAIIMIEDEEGNVVYNCSEAEVVEFYAENQSSFIVQEECDRLNEILRNIFGDIYPDLPCSPL